MGEIFVEAYFTLSHKTIIVPKEISNNKVKKVSGFKSSQTLHFILIGQLGKYINTNQTKKSDINVNEILDLAFEVICLSYDLIPCRCVLVECNDKVKSKNLYESYGFSFFQVDDQLNQYYKLIKN